MAYRANKTEGVFRFMDLVIIIAVLLYAVYASTLTWLINDVGVDVSMWGFGCFRKRCLQCGEYFYRPKNLAHFGKYCPHCGGRNWKHEYKIKLARRLGNERKSDSAT